MPAIGAGIARIATASGFGIAADDHAGCAGTAAAGFDFALPGVVFRLYSGLAILIVAVIAAARMTGWAAENAKAPC